MKKLIKPLVSVEDYTDEVVHAFCEYDGCSGNCRLDTIVGCASVNEVEADDEILF